MLDNLHIQHDVERLAGLRQIVGKAVAIIDIEASGFCMMARRVETGCACVNRNHVGPACCQRLRQNPGATSNI